MKIKTNVLKYKDPDTGTYTPIPIVVSGDNEEIMKDITELNEKLVQLNKNFSGGGISKQLLDIKNCLQNTRLKFEYKVATYDTFVSDGTQNGSITTNVIALDGTKDNVLRTNIDLSQSNMLVIAYNSEGTASNICNISLGTVINNGDGTFDINVAANRYYLRISYLQTGTTPTKPLIMYADDWNNTQNPDEYGELPVILNVDLKDKSIDFEKLTDECVEQIQNITITVTNPVKYKGDEINIFNKGVCIGDSLTAGAFDYYDNSELKTFVDFTMSWCANVERMTGVTMTNKGDSGKTYETWWNTHSGDDLSGYKFAIIALGVNDAYLNNGWSTGAENALTNIVNKLKAENNGIKIFIATLPPYFRSVNQEDHTKNSYKMYTVNEGIKRMAETLNLYLIDLSQYCTMTYDEYEKWAIIKWGHFNARGYYTLAKEYISYISYIIANNIEDFKNVQYIGTNYNN